VLFVRQTGKSSKRAFQGLDKGRRALLTEETKEAKEMVFHSGYDATKMFWLINENGVYDAGSGLPPVVHEIFVGMLTAARQATSLPHANTAALQCLTTRLQTCSGGWLSCSVTVPSFRLNSLKVPRRVSTYGAGQN
jgi:hypothetical protein